LHALFSVVGSRLRLLVRLRALSMNTTFPALTPIRQLYCPACYMALGAMLETLDAQLQSIEVILPWLDGPRRNLTVVRGGRSLSVPEMEPSRSPLAQRPVGPGRQNG
jgi:hypothetical protein